VNWQSLERLYSSKTDDELLTLSADESSLRDEAKQILIRELRRRGLDPPIIAHDEAARSSLSATQRNFLQLLKFSGVLIFNVFVAVLGTAALEAEIGSVVHPRSIVGLLWKWWSLDLSCAAPIGFLVWKRWKARASMWTWTVPAVWFGVGLVFVLISREQHSVLVGGDGIWSQFSGVDCQNGYRAGSGCVNFWAFTAPFVRSVSYSIGAYLSSKMNREPHHGHSVTSASDQAAP
jgi:hypothetical protein